MSEIAPASTGQHRRTMAAAALLALGGALAGGLVGHAAWPSSPSATPPLQVSSGTGSNPGPGGSGNSGSGDSGSGGFGSPWSGDPGSGSDGSGSNGSGSDGSSSEGGSDLSAAASAVSAALVNINTTNGYSGAQAAGTGIVLTADGEVLTNNHVISGATSISVTDVGNGQTYDATVVGYDRSHDIAVLALEGASGLQTASIGDSSKLSVGDEVVGVGNAGGDGGEPSAAPGTVTALDQSITASDASDGSSERLTGLIQIAADIEPGDSGGALVDSDGKVVGVNTAGSAGESDLTGETQGFAVPINTAISIAEKIEDGKSSSTIHIGGTAFLGVQISADDSGNVTGSSGATVAGVQSGTPAEDAGLSEGDTITAIDDDSIDSPTALASALAGHQPGDKVTLHWVDSTGQEHSAKVKLASGPAA